MHGEMGPRDRKCCWYGKWEDKSKCEKTCCNDFTLECEACNAGVSEDEFCRSNPYSPVCDPYVLSHPDNCFAFKYAGRMDEKEIMHGEMGPRDRKCCWYGKWEDKSKCEKTSHPDNCYHPRSKKEIMHGEVGPRDKACCWYGEWEDKSKCEKKPSHPDNCYSTILNKEVMHGEMGARKCCWDGDWKSKSKCEK